MTTNSEPTVSEQVDIQVQPQQITEEDPTRKAISEALEQSYKNLEFTMNKWDTLGGVWGSGLFDELAKSCKDLEEVAELIKASLDSAQSRTRDFDHSC
jgi:preprotein translocase subunit SecF